MDSKETLVEAELFPLSVTLLLGCLCPQPACLGWDYCFHRNLADCKIANVVGAMATDYITLYWCYEPSCDVVLRMLHAILITHLTIWALLSRQRHFLKYSKMSILTVLNKLVSRFISFKHIPSLSDIIHLFIISLRRTDTFGGYGSKVKIRTFHSKWWHIID